MKTLNLVLILTLLGCCCAVSHGENIVAYCISNNKYYTLPQVITADVAIDGVYLNRDYTIRLIVENEGYAQYHTDTTVTRAEGTQTEKCDGTYGGWMWFRSRNVVQVRLPQNAVPGCYDVTIELYSGRYVQEENLLDREVIPEHFCAWTNNQPEPDNAAHPTNACSLADSSTIPDDTSSCAPQLSSPADGATLPNGEIDSTGKCIGKHIWEFDWSDVPGATMYHLYVKGANAIYPAIDVDTTQSWYRDDEPGVVSSCVYDENRFNWMWKVSAYVNGQWCESPERHFDVESGGPNPSNPYPTDPYPTDPTSSEEPQSGYLGCRQVGNTWVCFD